MQIDVKVHDAVRHLARQGKSRSRSEASQRAAGCTASPFAAAVVAVVAAAGREECHTAGVHEPRHHRSGV